MNSVDSSLSSSALTKEAPWRTDELRQARLRARKRAEIRFQWYGRIALLIGLLALVTLLSTVLISGIGGFQRTTLQLPIASVARSTDGTFDCNAAFRSSAAALFGATSREDRRAAASFFTSDAPEMLCASLATIPAAQEVAGPLTLTLPTSSWLDQLFKGKLTPQSVAAQGGRSGKEIEWYDSLVSKGLLVSQWDFGFLVRPDSRQPELAGISGALAGSAITILICFLLSFPLGVAAAVYLEEFAPRNRWTDLVEININNLAAVPSIIFGLLGLAVILGVFGVPRSTPLAGGIVLALMTLPTIIIACRSALRGVPPSIRQGALAIGASPMQVVFHHVLPLALPGTCTGAIIGLSRALGETAPLLMIGMVAFIAEVPTSPFHAASALPVQVYLWAESSERGFVEKTSAGILVILLFLMCMNGFAVFLRRRFERRW